MNVGVMTATPWASPRYGANVLAFHHGEPRFVLLRTVDHVVGDSDRLDLPLFSPVCLIHRLGTKAPLLRCTVFRVSMTCV